MSVRKLTASMLTALAIMAGAVSAQAQHHVPPADPFAFDPDFRWFEPVDEMELAGLRPKKRANTGWYGTYDRLMLYGNRPELDDPNVSEVLLDRGWGHRYEIGYMLPGKESGWGFTWINNGVSQGDFVRREALNRFNGDQLENAPGGDFPTGPPFGLIVPQEEANNIGFNTRFYDIGQTENWMDLNSYELNKSWRLEPYHYGGILEPLVGVRWLRVNDLNRRNSYQSTFDAIPLTFPIGSPLEEAAAEQITTNTARTRNEMLAAQLGFRYLRHRDRFLYSAQFKAFAGGSWQSTRSQRKIDTFFYSLDGDVEIGGPMEATPSMVFEKQPAVYNRNNEFMVGYDVRGEVGYQLTRMIAVRTGFQLIHIARGVWRGGDGTLINGGSNDQDVLLVGATFGLELNR